GEGVPRPLGCLPPYPGAHAQGEAGPRRGRPQRKALEEQAERLGIAQHVYFKGFATDPVRNRLLHVADVAVFPSLYEPFGIVALEAMSVGLPVVAARSGGL